jgi:hypothetical protein
MFLPSCTCPIPQKYFHCEGGGGKVSDEMIWQQIFAEGSKEYINITKLLMNTDVLALKSQYYYNTVTG